MTLPSFKQQLAAGRPLADSGIVRTELTGARGRAAYGGTTVARRTSIRATTSA